MDWLSDFAVTKILDINIYVYYLSEHKTIWVLFEFYM